MHFGIVLKNKHGKAFVPISMEGVSDTDIEAAERMFLADMEFDDFRSDDVVFANNALFNYKSHTSPLAFGFRMHFGSFFGNRSDICKGHVNLVMISDYGEKHKIRLYDFCPKCVDSDIFSALTSGVTCRSPAVLFSNQAKAGIFNDLSDEEYQRKLDQVKGISKRFFGDKPEMPLFTLIVRYAEYTYAHCVLRLDYDAAVDDLKELGIAIAGACTSNKRAADTKREDLPPKASQPRNAGTSSIRDSARRFLETVSYADFYHYVSKCVLGHDDELKKACYYVYRYIDGLANTGNGLPYASIHRRNMNHFFITGRSGCGKTEFARALRYIFDEYSFECPVRVINTACITDEGYKGTNLSQALESLYEHNPAGYGIVFLDEIDKRLLSKRDGFSVNTYLSLIDGDGIDIEHKSDGDRSVKHYPSDSMLFVGLGAFDSLRSKREDSVSSLGFTADSNVKSKQYFKPITLSEISDASSSPEFVGRFSGIINFGDLTPDAVVAIIERRICDLNFVRDVKVKEKAVQQLVDIANGKRGVRSMVSGVLDVVFDHLIQISLESGYVSSELYDDVFLFDVVIESVDPMEIWFPPIADDGDHHDVDAPSDVFTADDPSESVKRSSHKKKAS